MNKVDVERISGPISILWTGGWDSTYRVVELSRQKVTIQPIYILDPKRESANYELGGAIKTITEMLLQRNETLAEFLPIKVINVGEIQPNEEITATAKQLKNEFGLGEQHDWTARVALQYPGIEMCIEKAIKGYMPIRETINKYGKLKMSAHGYVVDREQSTQTLVNILGNITLPIFDTTETEMLQNIKKWHYEDVMAHIWFCHRPIKGKPCGLCSPCHTKWDSNMKFLLPEDAQKRCEKAIEIEDRFGQTAGKIYKRVARKIAER